MKLRHLKHRKPAPPSELSASEAMSLLRKILARFDLQSQWTGPRSRVEEPWKTSGFQLYPQLEYRLVPRRT